MAVVHQKDKRSGITYAYETTYTWDKGKQQSRAKRTLIGRVNPKTGEVTPTDGRMKRASGNPKKQPPKRGPEPFSEHRRLFYGATYLMDMIGKKTSVAEDLRQCFPTDYDQILSIAYYLLLEDKNPLYRFEKWSSTHRHPFEKNITSQRSSELFMGITEDAVQRFFRLQGRRRMDDEH